MANNEDGQNSRLPQDILDKISTSLESDPEKLSTVMHFFCDQEPEKTERYLQGFRCVFNNDNAFKGLVDKLVEDIEKFKNYPHYLRIIADILSNYRNPKIGDEGQFDFLSNMTSTNIIVAYNFIFTLSKLDPIHQDEVIQLIINLTEVIMGPNSALKHNFAKLLQLTTSRLGKGFSVGLVGFYLCSKALNNLLLWWRGDITKTHCTKNIIDSLTGMAAGIGGGIAGAAAVTFIVTLVFTEIDADVAPGAIAFGSITGGVVGGVALAKVTTNLSNLFTQKIFNLPKDAALENTHKFLELDYELSNDGTGHGNITQTVETSKIDQNLPTS